MKSIIKQEKGITMIALVVTVMILLIVTNVLIYNAQDSMHIKALTNLYNDIELLKEKVSEYYERYGEIPAKIKYTNLSDLENTKILSKNNDIGDFYVIDLEAMQGITLNYGKDYEQIKNNEEKANEYKNVYIINKNSHNIFYVQGITIKENGIQKTYYTNYTEPDETTVDLKYIDGILIPDGYYYIGKYKDNNGYESIVISTNREENVENITENQYIWQKKISNTSSMEDFASIKLTDEQNEQDFLKSVAYYKGYFKNRSKTIDIDVIYLPIEKIMQPVTSINIEAEKTELKVGEKTILKATINPEYAFNKEIEWIIEDTNIITIGEPVTNEDKTVSVEVTAVSSGTTKIIAKSIYGENGSEVTNECTIQVKKAVNYGTSIQTNYDTLYTTEYPNGFYGDHIYHAYGNGNYIRTEALANSQVESCINGGTKNSSNGKSYIYSGNNTNVFEESVSNRWITLFFHAGYYTSSVNLSNLKLNFNDNTTYTVREATTNEYIEPLVICESNSNNNHIWTNVMNILDAGSTSTSGYPQLKIMFKVKEKSELKGITFNTNKEWNTTGDGLMVFKHREGFEISITPLD